MDGYPFPWSSRWTRARKEASPSIPAGPRVDGLRGAVEVHAGLEFDEVAVADEDIVSWPGGHAEQVAVRPNGRVREGPEFRPGHRRLRRLVRLVVDLDRDLALVRHGS